MTDVPASRTGGRTGLLRMCGAAGVAGGLAWSIKGVAILAVDEQPPLAFELALPLFGLGLVGVALLTARGTRRTIVLGLAWLAVVTGLVALTAELLDLAWDESTAASALALLLGQLMLPGRHSAPAALVFWIGVGTIPALAVGGALAEIDERLLEIPLVFVGLAWMLAGWVTWRHLDAVPASP